MGNIFAHHRNLPESHDSTSNAYYHYPPRNGKFFGSNFIMGGDKFEASQPEAYLFGENLDLNYLGGRPSPFPYNAPHPNEPMHTLRALINIRKETLKLIPSIGASEEEDAGERDSCNEQRDTIGAANYTIEFVFDSDVDCTIVIYFLCHEDATPAGVKYTPRDAKHRSAPFRYKSGVGQLFSQSCAIFNPHHYNASDLIYHIVDEKGDFNASAPFPVVIHCVADEGDEPRQSHSLIATIEKVYEDMFTLKPIKQKIFVDGLSYLLQEIYGIENKVTNKAEKITTCEDDSENSFECVICMSDLRDTLILPCRHLCLCKSCANSLRYQASNCPICRVPFRALLQIKAVKRVNNHLNSQIILSDSMNDVVIDIPPGFETVPLVEALNGTKPFQHSYLNMKHQSIERIGIAVASTAAAAAAAAALTASYADDKGDSVAELASSTSPPPPPPPPAPIPPLSPSPSTSSSPPPPQPSSNQCDSSTYLPIDDEIEQNSNMTPTAAAAAAARKPGSKSAKKVGEKQPRNLTLFKLHNNNNTNNTNNTNNNINNINCSSSGGSSNGSSSVDDYNDVKYCMYDTKSQKYSTTSGSGETDSVSASSSSSSSGNVESIQEKTRLLSEQRNHRATAAAAAAAAAETAANSTHANSATNNRHNIEASHTNDCDDDDDDDEENDNDKCVMIDNNVASFAADAIAANKNLVIENSRKTMINNIKDQRPTLDSISISTRRSTALDIRKDEHDDDY